VPLICPKTAKPLSFDVETHYDKVQQNWNRQLRLSCVHCKGVHQFSWREAYCDKMLRGWGRAGEEDADLVIKRRRTSRSPQLRV
jgi:hypothetical protein